MLSQQTLHTGQQGAIRQQIPVKIVYPRMDYPVNDLYRVKLEAPLMEGY
jgi:hypothetical protein